MVAKTDIFSFRTLNIIIFGLLEKRMELSFESFPHLSPVSFALQEGNCLTRRSSFTTFPYKKRASHEYTILAYDVYVGTRSYIFPTVSH